MERDEQDPRSCPYNFSSTVDWTPQAEAETVPPPASHQTFDYSNDMYPGRVLLILNPQKSQQHSLQEIRGAPELFESLSILHFGSCGAETKQGFLAALD